MVSCLTGFCQIPLDIQTDRRELRKLPNNFIKRVKFRLRVLTINQSRLFSIMFGGERQKSNYFFFKETELSSSPRQFLKKVTISVSPRFYKFSGRNSANSACRNGMMIEYQIQSTFHVINDEMKFIMNL